MDKFSEIYILPQLRQEEKKNLNSPIPVKEMESIIKSLPIKTKQKIKYFRPDINI